MGEVYALSEIRIRFVRGEEVKYISHLDLMKVFERAARRAEVPIFYSQGFNPHPQMVFGLPLSVGVTSEAEYADIKLREDMEPEKMKNSLNGSLPEGIKIINASRKTSNANIMADIAMASYDVLAASEQKLGPDDIGRYVDEFLRMPEIMAVKEGKHGVKEINIRPMIHRLEGKVLSAGDNADKTAEMHACSNRWLIEYVKGLNAVKGLSFDPQNIFCLSMLLGAGSTANLKPELLIGAFEKYVCKGLKQVKIHRTGLLVKKGEKMLEPLENEALIY